MHTNLSRFQALNRLAVAMSVAAVVVLAYLAFPLLTGFRSEAPITGDPLVKTVAGLAAMRQQAASPGVVDGKVDASDHRIQQMEAELKALQAEAAKNPARPTMAQVQRDLDRMVAERHGGSEVSRLERLVRGSVGVSLVLAVALGGLALLKLRSSRSHPDRPAI